MADGTGRRLALAGGISAAPAWSLWFKCRSAKIRDLPRPRRSQTNVLFYPRPAEQKERERKSAALLSPHPRASREINLLSFSQPSKSNHKKNGMRKMARKIQRGFRHLCPIRMSSVTTSPRGVTSKFPSQDIGVDGAEIAAVTAS